jgi:hypothetical protein
LRLVPYPLCLMGMSSKWACRAHGHVEQIGMSNNWACQNLKKSENLKI